MKAIAALTCALLMAGCASSGSPEGAGDGGGPGERTKGAESFQQPFTDVKAYPVFASSEIVVGRNRFLVGLLDDNDAPIGSPKIDMDITFFDLGESATEPVGHTAMRFIWIDKPYVGLYGAQVSFDDPGKWGAEVSIRGAGIDEQVKAGFEVRKKSSTPALGDRPPASDSPTASTAAEIKKISTDNDPTPRFYELSIAQALKSDNPSVVVFATPKFCSSATCGPTLDVVEGVAAKWPEVNFVHVEPYQLPADPGNLKPVPAALEWGLPTEPWVFVMDSSGRLQAKYEGIVSGGELNQTLRGL
ncbi:MAG: hypothetical protein M3454_06205 [Actinomycetota bacterium]|nr:hypothetical protein [Actinomycetota bacterium]